MLGIIWDLGLHEITESYTWKANLHFWCGCKVEIEIREGDFRSLGWCLNHQKMLRSLMRASLDRTHEINRYVETRQRMLDLYLELADCTGRVLL